MVEVLETICAAGAGAGSSLSVKATQSSGGEDESSLTNRPAFGLPTGTASSSDVDDDVTTAVTQTRIVETEAPAVSSSRSSAAGAMMVQQPLGGVAAWVVNGLVAVAGYLVV